MGFWSEVERWATVLLDVFVVTGALYLAELVSRGVNPFDID